jgi:hypothetical protein
MAPKNPRSERREAEAEAWLHFLITAGNRVKNNEPPLQRPAEAEPRPKPAEVEPFTEGHDLVAARMTPAQITEAQKLAREWKSK